METFFKFCYNVLQKIGTAHSVADSLVKMHSGLLSEMTL